MGDTLADLPFSSLFRNDNPDKGTETSIDIFFSSFLTTLEMITPIRGRKQVAKEAVEELKSIRNDNPDKGTETYSTHFY